MTKEIEKKLLNIPEVVDEINRHLWIESEKAGHDIGFEVATRDWMNKYAQDWMAYYMPKKRETSSPDAKSDTSKKRTRGRSAKNYAA